MRQHDEPTDQGPAGTNRRNFLRTTTAVAGTAALARSFTILPAEARGANERIGVGFIGTGGRAQAHIEIVNDLKKRGLAQPVAVCDVYRPRLQAASASCGYRAQRAIAFF